MGNIIRFSTDEVFNTDSQEYDILGEAAKTIKGVNGAIVEIGTRRGGSAKLIIDSLSENQDTQRPMFCIDPYGNIELECTNINLTVHYPSQDFGITEDKMSKERSVPVRFDYTNAMRNRIIPSLYFYAYSAGLDFTFFCLEDTEFFNRYHDGVPVYNEIKTTVNEYALVFFDGPHTNDAVTRELDFFIPRSNVGTAFVFDDIWMYSHDEIIEPMLAERGFELLRKGNVKASYRRVS